ncbi:hypothetical protein AB5N19_10315 [Seiridium cardinale]
MSKTFLDYLSQPNPYPRVHKQGTGYSTASQANYGPDKYIEWEDITWENLKATFGDILKKPMGQPQVRDSKDIPSEKTDIFEEDSVTQLAVAWNEQVLRHVFEGTYNAMCEYSPQDALRQGRIYLEKNTGRGHVRGLNGRNQMPDWCAYQKKPGEGPYFPNIVPGDSKPAGKWKSEWVKSKKGTLRRKAHRVMVQMTKYMWEAKTRYGFILSEEELVPVRLSIFAREGHLASPGDESGTRKDWIEESDRFFEDEGNDEESPDEASQESNAPSNASYSGSTRMNGLLVEYSRIPWKASGREVLTMNLVLWWLPVLAVQGSAIKQSGTYTSLGKIRRGTSPSFQLDQTERDMLDKVYGEDLPHRKRKAEDEEEDNEGTDTSSESTDTNSDGQEASIEDHRGGNRSSSRIDQQTTKGIPQSQYSRLDHSSDRITRQSKRRRSATPVEFGMNKRSHDVDDYALSFQSAG